MDSTTKTLRPSALLRLQTAILIALFVAERLIVNQAVCALIELVGISTLITAMIQEFRNRNAQNETKVEGYLERMFRLSTMLIALVIMSKCSHLKTLEILRNLV